MERQIVRVGICDNPARVVGKMKMPDLPIEKLVVEHNMSGHALYRSLCAHCVRGAGFDRKHGNTDKEEKCSDQEKRALHRVGFLISMYRVDCWWFELVEVLSIPDIYI